MRDYFVLSSILPGSLRRRTCAVAWLLTAIGHLPRDVIGRPGHPRSQRSSLRRGVLALAAGLVLAGFEFHPELL